MFNIITLQQWQLLQVNNCKAVFMGYYSQVLLLQLPIPQGSWCCGMQFHQSQLESLIYFFLSSQPVTFETQQKMVGSVQLFRTSYFITILHISFYILSYYTFGFFSCVWIFQNLKLCNLML